MRGHIRKRGKRSWSIVIDIGRDANGRRRQKWHPVAGTKADAERELTRILKQADEGIYISPSKVTVEDHLKKWLSVIEPNVARKTFIRYQEICQNHLIPALGQGRLRNLTAAHIDFYYAAALREGKLNGKGGLAPQTVLHHHRILSEALERACKWEVLARNPAKSAEPPRVKKTEVRALDADALEKLLAAAHDTKLYAPTLLAVSTGLRRGELLGLKWEDLELDKPLLHVRRSVEQVRGKIHVKSPKTQTSLRKVTLPDIAVQEFKKHRISQTKDKLRLGPIYSDEGWIFARENGAIWAPDTFTSAFRRLIRDAGLPPTRFHDLRHTHATQLLKDGIFIKVVSERLGHSSVNITLDTYSHVLPGMQDEAAEKMNSALSKILKGA